MLQWSVSTYQWTPNSDMWSGPAKQIYRQSEQQPARTPRKSGAHFKTIRAGGNKITGVTKRTDLGGLSAEQQPEMG